MARLPRALHAVPSAFVLASLAALATTSLSGCLVGGPLFGKTRVEPVVEHQRDPEVVTLRRYRLGADWGRGRFADDVPDVTVRVNETQVVTWAERELTGARVTYAFGKYELFNDVVGELTYVNVFGPIFAIIDLFRVPYYLARGELEVAGRSAAGLLYVLPGISLAMSRVTGDDPVSPERGTIVYPPELEPGEPTTCTEERDLPGSHVPVEVIIGNQIIERLETDGEGRVVFRALQCDALLDAVGEGAGEEIVFRLAPPEEHVLARLPLSNGQVATLVEEHGQRQQ